MRPAVVLQHFEGGGHDVHDCEEVAPEAHSILDAPELQTLACQRPGVELLGLLVQRESKRLHVVAVDQPVHAVDPDEAERLRARKGGFAREREGPYESPLTPEGND